jgi:aspartyl-tRNA synthetase
MLEDDLYAKRCDFLYLNINDIGSIFTIKVNIDLKDCKKEVLLQSIDVKTKEKDYYKGYNEVVREALVSLRGKLAIPNKNSNKEEVVSNKVEEKTVTIKSKTKEEKQSTSEVLTAESTKNGYNLLDSNNKLIFELLKTSNPSIFNAKKGSISGILTLNGNNAKFESYQNEVLIVEEFQVKF